MCTVAAACSDEKRLDSAECIKVIDESGEITYAWLPIAAESKRVDLYTPAFGNPMSITNLLHPDQPDAADHLRRPRLDAAIGANDAVIAAYPTRAAPTELPFWLMLFNNVTIRLLGSDDFSAEAKQQAAQDLTKQPRPAP